jgi:hypothetical protein
MADMSAELAAYFAAARRHKRAFSDYRQRVVELSGQVSCPKCESPVGRRCANLSVRRRRPDAQGNKPAEEPVKYPHELRLRRYELLVGPLPAAPKPPPLDDDLLEQYNVWADQHAAEKFARQKAEEERVESLVEHGKT